MAFNNPYENGYHSLIMDSSPPADHRSGMLCYLAGICFPIIYLTTEPYKSDRFIRFHSFQSILFILTWAGLTFVNDFIRLPKEVNDVLSTLWLVFLAMWVVLMFKAYRGRKFKLLIIGSVAERWAGQPQGSGGQLT